MGDGEAGGGRLAALLPLFRELGDLKRIRSAGAPGSVAERLFARAWAALSRGEPAREVMRRTTAAALAAARLGDMDLASLQDLGLSAAQADAVLRRSVDEVSGPLDSSLVDDLKAALAAGAPEAGSGPDFVDRLARQPRAGVTCPGRPRLLLQPPESHAEHCLMVAVLGVLASPGEGADPTQAFVAGLAHHLHNVFMPDSGFTGEVLLGEHLDPVIARTRERALGELAPDVADRVRAALAPIGGDATPEARAFHIADVLDRVLEIEQHLKAARVSLDDVLGPYALVHDGPVKPLHDAILREAGLQ
ncbi:MAG: hypothetical protein INR64_09245 [Caulobacteraceae bacterium]|nr:hypothetical protein [Caulobacter sp.]